MLIALETLGTLLQLHLLPLIPTQSHTTYNRQPLSLILNNIFLLPWQYIHLMLIDINFFSNFYKHICTHMHYLYRVSYYTFYFILLQCFFFNYFALPTFPLLHPLPPIPPSHPTGNQLWKPGVHFCIFPNFVPSSFNHIQLWLKVVHFTNI